MILVLQVILVIPASDGRTEPTARGADALSFPSRLCVPYLYAQLLFEQEVQTYYRGLFAQAHRYTQCRTTEFSRAISTQRMLFS